MEKEYKTNFLVVSERENKELFKIINSKDGYTQIQVNYIMNILKRELCMRELKTTDYRIKELYKENKLLKDKLKKTKGINNE